VDYEQPDRAEYDGRMSLLIGLVAACVGMACLHFLLLLARAKDGPHEFSGYNWLAIQTAILCMGLLLFVAMVALVVIGKEIGHDLTIAGLPLFVGWVVLIRGVAVPYGRLVKRLESHFAARRHAERFEQRQPPR
jgi:small-conductance mechanosensitive channel